MSLRFVAGPLALLTLLTPALCFGQGADRAERAMQERQAYRQLKEALNLTPDQNEKIRLIRRKYAPRMDAVRAKYHQTDIIRRNDKSPEGRKVLDNVMRKVNLEIAPILKEQRKEELAVYTPEQRKLVVEYEKKQASRK